MKIEKILSGIDYETIQNNYDNEINHISYNSREIKNKSMFIAISGARFDGHNFIENVISEGANTVLVSKDVNSEILSNNPNVNFFKVKDTSKVLSNIGANFYNNPSNKLEVVGVTGTNGKTTITYILESIFKNVCNTGVIGTVNYRYSDKVIKSVNTSPSGLYINEIISNMVEEDVDKLFLEVSSHGLELQRVEDVDFDFAIFTNLTSEHMDFHKTMDSYYLSKKRLFIANDKVKNVPNISAINIDDEYGLKLYNELKSLNKKVYTISNSDFENENHIKFQNVEYTSDYTNFEIVYNNEVKRVRTSLVGDFNIYNILSAFAYCIEQKVEFSVFEEEIKRLVVPGRMERVKFEKLGKDIDIFVDYSHTSDSIKNALKISNVVKRGKLITIFGCGGNRDKSKRPVMGKTASENSDICIVTSDNPRYEDPDEIIKDVLEGIDKTSNYFVEVDREKAIYKAIEMASDNDFIIICGKGHETYQLIKDRVLDFDDREVSIRSYKTLYSTHKM